MGFGLDRSQCPQLTEGLAGQEGGQRHPQSQKAELEALSSRQPWEGPQGKQGSGNKRVAGCAEAALQSAEGSRVMALGPSDPLDHHSRRSREARVRATLHVVGRWAGTAGCREKVEPTRLKRQRPRSSQPPAGCPHPCPGLASSPGGLLTGTEPGGERRGAARGEGGRARVLQAAPRKDVVGVRAGKLLVRRGLWRALKLRLGTVTRTPGPRLPRAGGGVNCLGRGAAAPTAEGREGRRAERLVVRG